MTPGDAAFTPSGRDDLEDAARVEIRRLVRIVRTELDGPILLGGSAGRGEAALSAAGDTYTWESDLEAYVVSPRLSGRSRIARLSPALHTLGPHASVDWMTPNRWASLQGRNRFPAQSRLTLQMYDLATVGRWLDGSLPSRTPVAADIAQDEGLRLVLNRILELATLPPATTEESRIRWFAKLAVAAFDCVALERGFYEPLLLARQATLLTESQTLRSRLNLNASELKTLEAAVGRLLGGTVPNPTELMRTAVKAARSAVERSMRVLTGGTSQIRAASWKASHKQRVGPASSELTPWGHLRAAPLTTSSRSRGIRGLGGPCTFCGLETTPSSSPSGALVLHWPILWIRTLIQNDALVPSRSSLMSALGSAGARIIL